MGDKVGSSKLDRLADAFGQVENFVRSTGAARESAKAEIARLQLQVRVDRERDDELQRLRRQVPDLELALKSTQCQLAEQRLRANRTSRDLSLVNQELSQLKAANAELKAKVERVVHEAKKEAEIKAKRNEERLRKVAEEAEKEKDEVLGQQRSAFERKISELDSESKRMTKKYERQLLQLEERNMDLSMNAKELERKLVKEARLVEESKVMKANRKAAELERLEAKAAKEHRLSETLPCYPTPSKRKKVSFADETINETTASFGSKLDEKSILKTPRKVTATPAATATPTSRAALSLMSSTLTSPSFAPSRLSSSGGSAGMTNKNPSMNNRGNIAPNRAPIPGKSAAAAGPSPIPTLESIMTSAGHNIAVVSPAVNPTPKAKIKKPLFNVGPNSHKLL